MPRSQRIKKDGAKYHIIVRSISEIDAFKNNKDKEKYLSQMKYYQEIYHFKVYAYCIMSNHAHFIIDSNGADISKIMHGLNIKYAMAYNRIHNRHGHLFQDRFKSKIVDTCQYLYTLTAYIHNNPLKLKGYEKCPEKYKYSSLKVYLGLEKDNTGLLDEEYIRKIFRGNIKEIKGEYINFVYLCDDEKIKREAELEKEKTEYRSEKKVIARNFKSQDIIEFIVKETKIEKIMIYMKNHKGSRNARALSVLLMRSLCNYRIKDICGIIGNITQSTVSRLCNLGVEIIAKEEKYRNIVHKFIFEQNIQMAT